MRNTISVTGNNLRDVRNKITHIAGAGILAFGYFRGVYFQARELLLNNFPEKIEEIENDLLSQKQSIFTEFNA